MSVSANRISASGFVSEESEDGLAPIHGVAIGSNDVTLGSGSRERKLWLPEVLEDAAHTLRGKQIVVDHENRSSREVVGEVTDAKFEEGVGVIYEGVLDDEELARKIGYGWLEVSPRIIHSPEMDEIGEVKVPQVIRKFDNLSIVSRGAADSNYVALGEHEELMDIEELQDAFVEDDDEGVAEYQLREELETFEFNLADWVYDNPEGARGASESLGCGSYHELVLRNTTLYMPCPSREDFVRSIAEKMHDEMESNPELMSEMIDVESEIDDFTIDRSGIAEDLASIWDVSVEEALGVIDTFDPDGPDDRESVSSLISREYEGLEPVEVENILSDADSEELSESDLMIEKIITKFE